jgi:tripartite ATP-independent transporter DctM subunit
MTCIFWGSLSGSGPATTAAVGLILLAPMVRHGYDKNFAGATIANASDLSIIIPPSIAFIIYGNITSVSVSALFVAGIIPGLLTGAGTVLVAYLVSRRRGYRGLERRGTPAELWQAFKASIWALLAPVVILGGIYSGIFTPTEAAVVASIYALLLGLFVYREIRIKDLPDILWETIVQSVKVLFIIAAAGFLGWLLIHQRIPQQVITGLTSLSSTRWVLMLIIIAILLVLGCFLEGIAVLVITIPVFMPLIEQFGMDPIQFGVIMILCSMLGLLTPPVGMSLYAVASISNVPVGALSKELWPYLLGIFIVLILITYVPVFSLGIPDLLMPR